MPRLWSERWRSPGGWSKLLGTSFPVRGQEVVVGVSIGIVMSTGPDQSVDDLLSNADVAMYTAKEQGRRQYAVFDPTLHAAVIARHELSGELTRGIDRGELVVLYQPIVDLDTGSTVGLEALVRWRHPTRGLVTPEEFISLAEESGSIGALGTYVLEQATAALARAQRSRRGRRVLHQCQRLADAAAGAGLPG